MTHITVLGGTGYTGANIVREAVSRGHAVTSFSRTAPAEPVEGVRYLTGSISEELGGLVDGADVVVGSLAPRGELEAQLRGIYADAARKAADAGTRLGIVGGWSALRLAPGATRTAYTDAVPAEYATEARIMTEVVEDLVDAAPPALDWFYVSPAALYGSYAPGEPRGVYRTGKDVALFDADGNSAISGVDFAKAILDEIEAPQHSREQFGVAY